MNYIKKIKSIGFKKINPIIICEHQYPLNGLYIENIEKILKDGIKDPKTFREIRYPLIYNSQFIEGIKKIRSFQYKIYEGVYLYLIILKENYTLVIRNDNIEDKIEHFNSLKICYKKNINVPISSSPLNEDFWKHILGVIGKDIQREILLKNIFSFK